MVDTLQMTRSLGSYADVLADAGIVLEGVRDEARGIEIAYATDDSRRVVPRTLFVCKGAAFRREYLLQALAAGAVAYVSEVDYEVDGEVGHEVPRVLVNDIRTALGLLADAAYDHPSLGLLADAAYDHPSGRVKVCAFTGTKGKTTSAYYLRSILSEHAREMGRPVPALLTGVEYDDGVERGDSLLTTPESFELERRFANAASVGCEHVVMEASSQAIKFRRTLGVDFAVGAFTNFGEDHISPIEHPTLEDYLESKLLLFERCRVAVVNLDMDVTERALAAAHASRALAAAQAARTGERVLTYSLVYAAADVFVPSYVRTERGIRATVRTPRNARELMIPSPAVFNLSNIFDAIARAVGAQGNENWRIVLERSEAIRIAVNETHGPAVVILTGKGNDPFRRRHGVREPYEPDGDQLRRALADWEREHV